MKGKLTVINSLLIPKLVYPSTILEIQQEIITEVDVLLSNFLWNWKKPKIKKDILIRKTKYGGLKIPCLECKIKAWQSIWAIRCLKNELEDPLWVHIVNSMMPNELNLPFLLKTRPTENCLKDHCPNLPKFYVEIIKTWTKVRENPVITTIEQIKNECLWLNTYILANNATLYNRKCLLNKLCYMLDILDDNNNFKKLDQINNEYNVKLNFLEYMRLIKSIPYTWKQILKHNVMEDNTTIVEYNKLKRYKNLKSGDIYWLLLPLKHNMLEIPKTHTYWINKYNLKEETFYKLINIIYKCNRITFIQALQYKIINKIFNCNHWLCKVKIVDSSKCRFCEEEETIEHFFYNCQRTKAFWLWLNNWWNRLSITQIPLFTEQTVILGITDDNFIGLMLNSIILIAKGTIYSNKSTNREPDLYAFLCQLKFFLKIEKGINLRNNTLDKFMIEWGPLLDNI